MNVRLGKYRKQRRNHYRQMEKRDMDHLKTQYDGQLALYIKEQLSKAPFKHSKMCKILNESCDKALEYIRGLKYTGKHGKIMISDLKYDRVKGKNITEMIEAKQAEEAEPTMLTRK